MNYSYQYYLNINLSNIHEIKKLVNNKEHIYRFVPIERLIETLEKSKLTFINPSIWKDPFDNFLFRQSINNNFLSSIYCLCFTLNPHSEAYWKAYSRNGFAARFKINFDNFLSFMSQRKETSWLIKMEYLVESKLIEKLRTMKGLKSSLLNNYPNDIFLEAFHYKRIPFKYEEEVRFLVKSNKTKGNFKSYKINISDIIEEIRLDPRMGKYQELALKEYLKKFQIKVTKSQLFSEKKININ